MCNKWYVETRNERQEVRGGNKSKNVIEREFKMGRQKHAGRIIELITRSSKASLM